MKKNKLTSIELALLKSALHHLRAVDADYMQASKQYVIKFIFSADAATYTLLNSAIEKFINSK